MSNVLLVDDEAPIADVLARSLRARGHVVQVVASGRDTLHAIAENLPDVLVLDVNLPDLTGWEVLRRLSAVDRERLPVIVFSASPLSPSRVEEFRPSGVLTKPFPIDALVRLVNEVTRAPAGTGNSERSRA
jgi:DNA-binding response OmpR family regulator